MFPAHLECLCPLTSLAMHVYECVVGDHVWQAALPQQVRIHLKGLLQLAALDGHVHEGTAGSTEAQRGTQQEKHTRWRVMVTIVYVRGLVHRCLIAEQKLLAPNPIMLGMIK